MLFGNSSLVLLGRDSILTKLCNSIPKEKRKHIMPELLHLLSLHLAYIQKTSCLTSKIWPTCWSRLSWITQSRTSSRLHSSRLFHAKRKNLVKSHVHSQPLKDKSRHFYALICPNNLKAPHCLLARTFTMTYQNY